MLPYPAGGLTGTDLPEPVPHHTEAPGRHHHQEEPHEPADDVDDGHGVGDTPAGEKVSRVVHSGYEINLLYPVEMFLLVSDPAGGEESAGLPFTPFWRSRSVRFAWERI